MLTCIDVKSIFDSVSSGLSTSANILQIADVALRVVSLLFLPCFQILFRLVPAVVLTLETTNIQIQPGLKAKLWLIILVNKKKLNRVMLNGEGNENGIKINRSNQQKNKLHVQHTFFSNQQKNKFARAARFLSFFAVVLHTYNAVLQD